MQAETSGTIIGRTTDESTGESLPGASAVLLGTGIGTETDVEGEFRLTGLPPGPYTLSVSMLGFKPQVMKDIPVTANDTLRLSVRLATSPIRMPAIVVSASKRARNVVDAPTSVSLIGSEEIQSDNSATLNESLEYVPGVNMVGGQVNIRGSSGYSRGTGSRVLMLIDGFPALSADNGEVKWDAIPIDQIARVEIIKGAGSALYGTGALGGIINVITRNPSPEPETHFRFLGGRYSEPGHQEWRWSSSGRYYEGTDVSHSRQSGNTGFILGAGQKWTNGFRENAWHRRYKLFGKLRHRFKAAATVTATCNWALDDHGTFVLWKDRNEPLEVPESAKGDKTVSQKLNLHVDLYHLLNPQTGYRLKSFVYRTEFDNEVSGRTSSEAYKLGQEFQLDLQPAGRVALTVGTQWIHDIVHSSDHLFGNHTGLILAAYAQTEIEPTDRITLSAGSRYDRYRTDDRDSENRLSPKLGFSYRTSGSTTLRGTLGWGFRGPSIAEIYTDATFSAIPIIPNTALVAERSISAEVALDHRPAPWSVINVAAFWSRYQDLVEARPDAAGVVQFRNVARGRTAGVEASMAAAIDPVRLEGNYTFISAIENLPEGDLPLPYRPRHIAAAGLQTTFGRLKLEGRFRFRSRILRASGLLPEGNRDLIPVYLLDVSASYAFGEVQVVLKAHNALAYNYAVVERNLGSPRRISLGITARH